MSGRPADFIDIYAEIDESERDQILREMEDREETIMIKQVLKEEGLQEGLEKGHFNMLSRVLLKKYRRPLHDMKTLKGLRPEDQLELLDFMLDCDSFAEIEEWIRQRKSGNRI